MTWHFRLGRGAVALVASAVVGGPAAVDAAGATPLDTTFGSAGLVRLPVSVPNCAASFADLVRQPDGSLVAAGTGNLLTLARWNTRGQLRRRRAYPCTDDSRTSGVPLEPAALLRRYDGSLMAAGRAVQYVSRGQDQRLQSTFSIGQFDSRFGIAAGFGVAGIARPDLPGDEEGARALVQAPGRGVLAGGYAQSEGQWRWALVQTSANGRTDSRFGSGGSVLTAFPGTTDRVRNDIGAPPARTAVNALARQRDGRVVGVGTVVDGRSGRPRTAVARYLADGRLDSSFGGGDGLVVLPLPSIQSRGFAVGLQGRAAQSILIAGALGDPTNGRAGFFVARLRMNGTPDRRFGTSGVTALRIRSRGATDLALTRSGRIAVAGSVRGRMAVARLTANGRLDRTLAGGIVCASNRFDLAGGSPYPETDRVSVVSGPSGKLTVAQAMDGPGSDDVTWVLARFKATARAAGGC